MMRRSILATLFAIAALPLGGQPAPRLAATIDQSPGVRRDNGHVIVSNLHRIAVSLSVRANGANLRPFRLGGGPAHDTLSVTAARIENGVKVEDVPVRAILNDSSLDYGDLSGGIRIEIPVPASVRNESTAEFIRWLQTESKPAEREQFQLKEHELEIALARLYMQNRTGTFRIEIRYSSYDRNYWTGTLQTTLDVEVANDGSFYDTLKTQSAPKPEVH